VKRGRDRKEQRGPKERGRGGRERRGSVSRSCLGSSTMANEGGNFPEKVRGRSILMRQASCDNPPRDNPGD